METASKIISFILILLMIGLVGYKSYTAIENNRNAKLWLVLIQNNYLTTITDPTTIEVINPSSYVNLDTNEFIILN